MMRQSRYFEHHFTQGPLKVEIPEELTPADLDDIEAHFKLIVQQARRRAKDAQP